MVNERDLTSSVEDGSTAWIMVSCSLVLFMSLPGLALFYSGMVRVTNVLATVAQTFAIACIITLCWLFFGYSLAFAPAEQETSPQGTSIFGDGSRLWLQGLEPTSVHYLAPLIPESVFCFYQLTFEIITAALICGSFADRMKFMPMCIFMILWHFTVYCPIAHANWHQNGFLFIAGIKDFAGGNVVHIASGVSGLMSSIVVGNRRGFGKERFEPHNTLLTFMGTCMLWVGWMSFNGGSALAADSRAGGAMLMTHIATATSAITWSITEMIYNKTSNPTVLGMVSGAVAGLVVITPGCGFVDPTGAFFTGFFGGPLCFFGAQLKHYLGFDDALDAFGIHAIGGIIGGIAVGFFAVDIYGLGYDEGVYYAGLKEGGTVLGNQIYGIIVCAGWAAFMSYILLIFLDNTIGLRVSAADEDAGLDSSLHGESIVPTAKGNGATNTNGAAFELVTGDAL